MPADSHWSRTPAAWFAWHATRMVPRSLPGRLWDETNVSRDVADRLKQLGNDFHGIPVVTGVDIAYAIDNATDRANAFALTQKLWLEACGFGEGADDCRRALLIAPCSPHSTVGAASTMYRTATTAPCERSCREGRSGLADGLLIPDADIANRKPLAGVATPVGGDDPRTGCGSGRCGRSIGTLMPRPAAVWIPGDEDLVERAVEGLAQFIAAADLERIDRRLANVAGGRIVAARRMQRRRDAGGRYERIKLLSGRRYRAAGADPARYNRQYAERPRAGDTDNGYRIRCTVGGWQHADDTGVMHITLRYPASPLQPAPSAMPTLAG